MSALPQTSSELLRLVERSGLITPEDIEQRSSGQQPPTEAVACARWLIQKGLLTTFQADQLLQGKSRGFFLGNYRVLERLGGGATAGVFLCEHQHMKHRVAVKVLCALRLNEDARILDRFRREARMAAAVSHPHIVRTIDFDEDDGRHFLVMEYVEGVTLDTWMKNNPKAPLRVYVHFLLHAALGLQHIHEAGLIHRDLKPGNLLLDKQGTVKILDLGLAKFTDDSMQDGLSAVQGKNIMGTVDFMSPEQADGSQELDIRSDIYGLGATLYFLLTGGQVPFPAGTLGAKLIAIQFQQPKPVREFRPDADPLLQKIVERMMAKDPAKRFQSPEEAIAILHGWLNRPTNKSMTVKAGSAKAPVKTMQVKAGPVRTGRAALDETKEGKRTALSAPMVKPARPKTPTKGMPARPTPAKTPPARPARDGALRWALRAGACLLVLGALFVFKPWNLGHKATAQAASASP